MGKASSIAHIKESSIPICKAFPKIPDPNCSPDPSSFRFDFNIGFSSFCSEDVNFLKSGTECLTRLAS